MVEREFCHIFFVDLAPPYEGHPFCSGVGEVVDVLSEGIFRGSICAGTAERFGSPQFVSFRSLSHPASVPTSIP